MVQFSGVEPGDEVAELLYGLAGSAEELVAAWLRRHRSAGNGVYIPMSTETDYYTYLTSLMLRTRGTRFTSAQMLTLCDRFSVLTLAILSIFLISVSVIFLASPDIIGTAGAKYFGALSIVASVWILVITLFDYALGRGVLAHRLHQNAIKITKIARAMERELAKSSPDIDILQQLAAKYEDEIAETEVNHSSTDYRMYLYSRQKPKGCITAILFWIRNLVFMSFVFCICVPSNIIVLFVVVGATGWYFLH